MTDARRLGAVVLVAAATLLTACSSSASTSPSASTATSPSAAASQAASASAPASSAASPSTSVESATPSSSSAAVSTLAITAKEYSYESPAEAPAGVTAITVTNTGKEEHQAQIVRLADGVTMTQLGTALQNPDPSAALKLVTLEGGPTNVTPGNSVTTTSNLKAGTYAFLCFFATADGTPHIAKGMIGGLKVTGADTSDVVPAGDTTVTAKDFGYDLATTPLAAGKHTVTFKNDGPSPHEAGLVKLADGMTVADIVAQLTSGAAPSGPPPWTSVAGTAGVNPGSTTSFDIDVTAGNYAYICFIPDPKTGKSHLELGMIAPVTVK
jgi:plastocyanin